MKLNKIDEVWKIANLLFVISEFSVCCHPKILLPWQRGRNDFSSLLHTELHNYQYPVLGSTSDWLLCVRNYNCIDQSEALFNPDLGSVMSSVWNFCTVYRFILQENQWWCLQMLASFSGYGYISLLKVFETVMQTRDEVEGLHNCQEFSQWVFISGYVNTGKKFSIAFIK